jgi:hypothetical protein
MKSVSPNQTLDRMTRSAVSRMFQFGRPWRALRHRSALRWATNMGAVFLRRSTGIVLLILCLLSAGCVHHSTMASRDASFSPYVDTKVGQVSLREFLLARAAVLLKAEQLSVTHSNTNSRTFSIAGTNSWRGTAAAIDRRGYFLTAAHCVEKDPFCLAFLNEGKMQVQRARLVWRGDAAKKQPDLAILQVSLPLQQVFEWATEFTNGNSILAVGLSLDKPRVLKTQCMAGKILNLSEGPQARPPHYTVVSHDAPLRHGDSGGPLMSTDGHLLGINVGAELGFRWRRLSVEPLYADAHRPDLEWLRQIIEQDVTLQSGTTANQPNKSDAANPAIASRLKSGHHWRGVADP